MTNKRNRPLRAALVALLAPVTWMIASAILTPLPPELRQSEHDDSITFTDREGAVLREVRASDSSRAKWIALSDAGPWLPAALVAAEDARFWDHPGVDVGAVARAVVQAVWNRKVVSGASTLTMQLARLVKPHPRTLAGKWGEMALALRIEASLDKRAIIEQYLNRAPFGPLLRGTEAASRYYFDKPTARLSLAEAATLAAIPRGPTLYDVERHPDLVLRRRDRVLDRMRAAHAITAEEHETAKLEPLATLRAKGSFGAPHLVRALALEHAGSLVTTTLLGSLQASAEQAVLTGLGPLEEKHATEAAVVVIENATGDVLAYVGSARWDAPSGQNDGVRMKRQPGSALKPFIYALAIERGLVDAATPISDVPTTIAVGDGSFSPHNYDERYHGPVLVREALANSLNVPAVRVLERVGEQPALDRLHALGFASLDRDATYYGPALALGDGEVTLLELARAYATLARGGLDLPLRFTATDARASKGLDGVRVMPREVADVITDILSDRTARLASFGERNVLEMPFAVAAKTGTSKGFRDNWTVGFTREVTVAVWVGNFDGSPMSNVSGITGAGPIFRAVMSASMQGRVPASLGVQEGEGLVRRNVCALSGSLDLADCESVVEEWLPSAGLATRPARSMNERVTLDRRNGLRAGPGCMIAFTELRRFERFDGELASWAKYAGRHTAPDDFSPLCPGHAEGRVAIHEPPDGTRLIIDPSMPLAAQVVGVRVSAPAGAHVTLLVDGVETSDATRWPIARGAHVLVARASGFAPSSPVRVVVD